jgi:NAD+ kinase
MRVKLICREKRALSKVLSALKRKKIKLAKRTQECDFLLVIGGTDLMLKTLARMKEVKPVLGVSIYGPGFLCEARIENLDRAFERISFGEYKVEEVTRIYCSNLDLPPALNDIVVSPTKSATLMKYSLKVNGELIWKDRADGLIISTPTGSTAYALSAGGPVVAGDAKVLLIVPMNSLNQSIRPLVIGEDSKIEILDIESKYPCEVIIDGQFRGRVRERVRVAKASPALFIKFEKEFAKLMKKLERKMDILESISLSPSAKFVYKTLLHFGEMTQKEIEKECMLPRRTIRNALNQLLAKGLIEKSVNLRDIRQNIYFAR